MAFGDSDLPVFFRDMGETAIINGRPVLVLIDETAMPWEHSGVGSMEEAVFRITAPITAFAILPAIGQAVVVRGLNWTISKRNRPGDGRIVEMELKLIS